MVYGVGSIWSSMGYAAWCLIYFRVGKVPSMGIGALIYGGLSLTVSYGVFGESRTQDVSKGRSGLLLILNLFFFIPC